MPPDQFEIMRLKRGDGLTVRAFMDGHEQEPYEAVATVPSDCLE